MHLADLTLADPTFAQPGKIDLILGADVYEGLLRSSVRQGGTQQPIAQKTVLGWIISEPTSEPIVRDTASPQRVLTGVPDYELSELP